MRGTREPSGLDEACWQRIVARAAALARRGPKGDLRMFISAVAWILRTGAPWRDLAASYGRSGRVYRRFRRWAVAGRWGAPRGALTPRARRARVPLIGRTAGKTHAPAAGAPPRDGRPERPGPGPP